MAGSSAKATARAAEKAEFERKVETVMEQARDAAAAAYEAYEKTARKSEHGLIEDSCGAAEVLVFDPSRRLREALKGMDRIHRISTGAWSIGGLSQDVHSQSITAHEVACRAACLVLTRELPDEGTFHSRAYLD